MGHFKEIEGDLFEQLFKGEFDVVAQGLNCFNTQGAGIVIPFKYYFKTDLFPMELVGKGNINKLGQIDFKPFNINNGVVSEYNPDNKEGFNLYVCNCYTQYHYGKNHIDGVYNPVDYEAIVMVMRKINFIFKGKRIGLPAIGAGLAGGDINIIREIMKKELKDCDVTLVILKKTS